MKQHLRTASIIGALLAGQVAISAAQPPTTFTGTWTATKDSPPDVGAAPSPILGPRLGLRLEGNELTVVRPVRDVTRETKYTVGGPEVRMRIPGGQCQGDSFFIETAAWEGNALALTIVGTVSPGGGPPNKLNARRLLRVDAPDTLIVQGTMTQAGQTKPVATVYKRSADQMTASAPAAMPNVVPAAATIANVAWIAGVWSGGETNITEERWTPPAGGSMLAVARSLRNNNVMTSFEFLCIAERDGSLVYTAMPNARTPATDFMLTNITPDSATFENPGHDFPKKIRYAMRPDGTLEAVVSGDGNRSQTFVWKRQ